MINGETKTQSGDDDATTTKRVSSQPLVRALFRSATMSEIAAATTIQTGYRAAKYSVEQRLHRQQMLGARRSLVQTESQVKGAVAQQALETELRLRALTPEYLHWLIATEGPDAAFAPSCMHARGAVAFVDMKGFTSLAQNISKMGGHTSILFLDDAVAKEQVDLSSELTSAVLAEYWNLVIMYANKFNGDVVKFLGDAVQIIFPVRPLFSHIVNPGKADKLCQDRALLFAFELMRALEFFEIKSLDVGTSRMKLKIGLAFGNLTFRVVGGIWSRTEFVLSGPAAASAADLSSRAKDDETVAEAKFASLGAFKSLSANGSKFVRLRMCEKWPEAESLYHALTQTEDYFNVCTNLNPYAGAQNAFDEPVLGDSVNSFSHFQKLIASRASRHAGKKRPSLFGASDPTTSSSSGNVPHVLRGMSFAADRSSVSASSQGQGSCSSYYVSRTENEWLTPLLGNFVPMCALSQIVAGCHNAQLGHRYCSVLFISIKSFDPNAPEEEQTKLMQDATTMVQGAIYTYRGDLRQVAVDDKGLVLICVFGLAAQEPELYSFKAAVLIKDTFTKSGIRAGLGLTTGSVHYGPTGTDLRAEYAVVGSVVNLSARLMGKASNALGGQSTRMCNLLLDDATFHGLPPSCKASFISAATRVKGVSGPVEIYLALDPDETFDRLEQDFTIQALALCRDPEVVELSRSTYKRMHEAENTQQVFVADIFRLTLGLRRPEAVREVIKYITVMGVVNPRIDVGVLYAIIPSHAVRSDLHNALETLEKDIGLLKDSGDQVYILQNVQKHIYPLYQTLMRSFRHQLHLELAELYQDQLLHGHLRHMPRNSLHEIIGSHFSRAGVDYHLQAATYLNEGLRQISSIDPKVAEGIVERSQKLVKSWQSVQRCKAEKVAARSLYCLADMKFRQQEYVASFRASVGCIRAYASLGVLLSECRHPHEDLSFSRPPGRNDSGRRDSVGSLECSCSALRPGLKAFLFVHDAEDSTSSTFQFRCLRVASRDGLQLEMEAWEAVSLDNTPIVRPRLQVNVSVTAMSRRASEKAYQLGRDDPSVTEFYRVVIYDPVASKQILQSLAHMNRASMVQLSLGCPKADREVRNGSCVVSSSSEKGEQKEQAFHTKSKLCTIQ